MPRFMRFDLSQSKKFSDRYYQSGNVDRRFNIFCICQNKCSCDTDCHFYDSTCRSKKAMEWTMNCVRLREEVKEALRPRTCDCNDHFCDPRWFGRL